MSQKQPDPTERLARIRSLRSAAHASNRRDVHAEFVRSKTPSKSTASVDRKRMQAEKLLAQKEAEEQGKDFSRIKSVNYSVQDVELWDEKQAEKLSRMDTGFTDFAQIAAKKHAKLVAEIKPDLAKYNSLKASASSEASSSKIENKSLVLDSDPFYRSAHSLAYADPSSRPSQDAVDRLAASIKQQDERRRNFSRRRAFDDNDDVTYINERNAHFNKKISRAYDKYTAEIKANFERGTAL